MAFRPACGVSPPKVVLLSISHVINKLWVTYTAPQLRLSAASVRREELPRIYTPTYDSRRLQIHGVYSRRVVFSARTCAAGTENAVNLASLF
jgi:hypothetical protein